MRRSAPRGANYELKFRGMLGQGCSRSPRGRRAQNLKEIKKSRQKFGGNELRSILCNTFHNIRNVIKLTL
jgi:hypothetical protein